MLAFTTTRQAGDFNLASAEPAAGVVGRWRGLQERLGAPRLASAHQVHGDRVLEHGGGWRGWLRDVDGADGHVSTARGTAMVVTLADCVPVFLAHPSGACGILHSGWKGTAAGIVRRGLAAFARLGLEARDVRVHLGPAICGSCYEVGPEVYRAVTGRSVDVPTPLDLRAAIAAQARDAGAWVTASRDCTRCHNEQFFSHRMGDVGRQVAVVLSPEAPAPFTQRIPGQP